MSNGTCKMAVALLLSAPAFAPSRASSTGTVSTLSATLPTAEVSPRKDYIASSKDVQAATTAALEQLGYADPKTDDDGAVMHVVSLRILKRVVYNLVDRKFTIERIRQASASISYGGCSTKLDVSFADAKITWDHGSLTVGSKTAPLTAFFAAVDRQIALIQGSSGKRAWLDNCPKPSPLPIL